MKICRTCNTEKSEEEFHWYKKSLGKRHPDCKACRSQAKPKEWISGGRTCNKCKAYKVLDEFGYRKSGHSYAVCKECVKQERNGKAHPELSPDAKRTCSICKEESFLIDFPKNNQSAQGRLNICKPCYVTKNIHRTYNISADQIAKMRSDQNNACAICLEDFDSTKDQRVCVDHDHNCCSGQRSCGKCVRALLCGWCNRGLGHFKDDVNIMERAIKYVQKYA